MESTLFVEFDALFDTRAGILYSYGEQAVTDNINNSYFTRMIDKFKNIDYKDFQDRYSKRDKLTIRNSMTTPILYMISDFVESTMVNSIHSPDKMEPKIIINTYPYELVDSELLMIKELLTSYTKGYSEISFVFMPVENITPMYVRDRLSIMILYDYPAWLEAHSKTEALSKVTAPSVTLIGPELIYKEPDNAIVKLADRNKLNIFRSMEDYTSPFINLKLLPIHMFSLAIKYEGKKETTTP